ncbi:MAG: putative lipid II flippase FtsW [bacterium]
MARDKGILGNPVKGLDWALLVPVLVLLSVGLIMVSSSSLHLGDRYGNSFFYVNRHLFAMLLATIAAVAVFLVPPRWWEQGSTPLYFLGLLLLALILVPGVGKEVNGATRWVAIGPFNLQTSELMKLIMVVYMAGYLVRQKTEVTHSLWSFVKPMVMLLLAAVLTIMQPDFGTTVVLLVTVFGMLFLAGAPLWQFISLVLMALVALVVLVLTSPYRMERVTSFLNPWADPLGSGYQLSQALIAFGRGEWVGVGLGNGVQKQFYLPEAHTDFIMAVIGEEFGLVGTLLIVALFGLIIWRAFCIGAEADRVGQRFSAYMAYGVGLWVGFQAFINMGVNVGMLPTKGLTLPFVSYGNNSLIVSCMAIALLLRISQENQHASRAKGGAKWQRA